MQNAFIKISESELCSHLKVICLKKRTPFDNLNNCIFPNMTNERKKNKILSVGEL